MTIALSERIVHWSLDVLEFARQQEVADYLDPLVTATKQLFPDAMRLADFGQRRQVLCRQLALLRPRSVCQPLVGTVRVQGASQQLNHRTTELLGQGANRFALAE